MKLVQKYFLRQALIPLLITLAALSLLALLTQSLSTIDLIIENRQSAGTFLYITVLALPQLFAIIMPLAVFMATLYALNRLNVDSELVVTKASGVSPWQIASPAIRIATYALIVHLIINLFIQPLTFREMRRALLEVRTDIASSMVRAGEFTEPTPGLTVYAGEILPSGHMSNVIIYDERSADQAITYFANEGIVQTNKGRTTFTLIEGNVNLINENNTMEITKFESYTYDLTDILAINPVLHLKTSDRYLGELFFPSAKDVQNPKRVDKFKAEGHARLSAPLYNLALVLLALAFLARGEHSKMGYGRKIVIAAATGFGIRLIGFVVASAAESDPILNSVQYGIPISVAMACAWFLLNRKRATNIFKLAKNQRPGIPKRQSV
jgi:lipopolysaccharide export system permease protein